MCVHNTNYTLSFFQELGKSMVTYNLILQISNFLRFTLMKFTLGTADCRGKS